MTWRDELLPKNAYCFTDQLVTFYQEVKKPKGKAINKLISRAVNWKMSSFYEGVRRGRGFLDCVYVMSSPVP